MKYLHVTIHDNDFRSNLRQLGDFLYDTFYYEDKYPTEDDFPELKQIIKNMLYNSDRLRLVLRDRLKEPPLVDIEYFLPDIEFVEETNILDWDNGESIYIPMFDNGVIIYK